jgi:hypothetical protein
MSRMFLMPSTFLVLSTSALTQESRTLPSLSVTNAEKQFIFTCDGTTRSSQVIVRSANAPQSRPILRHRLDVDDDCSQAVWTHQMFGPGSSSTLVMVNPGRMGLNAQMETFYVDNGVLIASGGLPVAAHKFGSSQFRQYLSGMGTQWERTYEIVHGTFSVSRELSLLRSGAMCVAPSGEILGISRCTRKTINAQPLRPLCIEYQGNRGQLRPRSACSEISSRRVISDD